MLNHVSYKFNVCLLCNFEYLFVICLFFKIIFLTSSFGNTIRVSNGLDPDQDRLTGLIWAQTVCKADGTTTCSQRVRIAVKQE